MGTCTVCGAQCRDGELVPGGGCHRCHGMPPCTRCGHQHHRHSGGCLVRVVALGGLAIGRCGCTGYSAEPVAAPALLEPTELHLRRPGEPLPA
jgi:hypothetical protein